MAGVEEQTDGKLHSSKDLHVHVHVCVALLMVVGTCLITVVL